MVSIYTVHFSFAEGDIFVFQAEALDLNKTVLETVAEVAEDWRLDDIKGLLGRYNFKADMLDRKVSFLSGGEKVNAVCIHTSMIVKITMHVYLISLFSLYCRLGYPSASSWSNHQLCSSLMSLPIIWIYLQRRCSRFASYSFPFLHMDLVPSILIFLLLVVHIFQEAINEYQGTVITVSHDRYFIKQIVNRVLEVKDGTLQDYAGDYNVSVAFHVPLLLD